MTHDWNNEQIQPRKCVSSYTTRKKNTKRRKKMKIKQWNGMTLYMMFSCSVTHTDIKKTKVQKETEENETQTIFECSIANGWKSPCIYLLAAFFDARRQKLNFVFLLNFNGKRIKIHRERKMERIFVYLNFE